MSRGKRVPSRLGRVLLQHKVSTTSACDPDKQLLAVPKVAYASSAPIMGMPCVIASRSLSLILTVQPSRMARTPLMIDRRLTTSDIDVFAFELFPGHVAGVHARVLTTAEKQNMAFQLSSVTFDNRLRNVSCPLS